MPLGIVAAERQSGTSAPARATRKSRNLARDPRCVVSVATHPFDLRDRGHRRARHRHGELASVAEAFVETGWPAEVARRCAHRRVSARRRPGRQRWYVYRISAVDRVRVRHGPNRCVATFDLNDPVARRDP